MLSGSHFSTAEERQVSFSHRIESWAAGSEDGDGPRTVHDRRQVSFLQRKGTAHISQFVSYTLPELQLHKFDIRSLEMSPSSHIQFQCRVSIDDYRTSKLIKPIFLIQTDQTDTSELYTKTTCTLSWSWSYSFTQRQTDHLDMLSKFKTTNGTTVIHNYRLNSTLNAVHQSERFIFWGTGIWSRSLMKISTTAFNIFYQSEQDPGSDWL